MNAHNGLAVSRPKVFIPVVSFGCKEEVQDLKTFEIYLTTAKRLPLGLSRSLYCARMIVLIDSKHKICWTLVPMN